jgi:subtilase family serine protease
VALIVARRRGRQALLGAGLLLCLGLFAPVLSAAASPHRVGARPIIPPGAKAVGALSQTTKLNLTVTLAPRDPAALATYAQAVSTPGSAVYHQYLTVAQFAAKFGPTPQAVASVRSALRSQGLAPGPVAADGLSFTLAAPASAVAGTFSTSFERYRLPAGRLAYANTSAPQVGGVAANVIQGVLGLNDLTLLHPEGLARSWPGAPAAGGSAKSHTASTPSASGPAPCSDATTDGATNGGYPGVAYTADQIAGAYDYSNLYAGGDLGSGATVALYELEPYTASDITAYQNCYGISPSTIGTPESVDGGAVCNGDPSCGLEDVLDIEDVAGLAPGADLKVYEGPNTNSGAYDTYAQIVSDNTAKVISTAWGECEAQMGASAAEAENTLFQEAATQGQSIFAAAGDDGTTDCTDANGNPVAQQAVDDPASQPYVTGVGGTTLVTTPSRTETVWNDGDAIQGGAGGGGVSTLWTQPGYQSKAAIAQASVSCGSSGTTCREVPDVSADADENTGYVIYWDGSWTTVGGTSGAAPTWAALAALADASAPCAGSTIGFANPGLYRAAASDYSAYFNDIVVGNNNYGPSAAATVTGYSAGPGYDMASGLGTPIGDALASVLCDTVTVANPGSQSATSGKAIGTLAMVAKSSAGATPLSYAATGLPPGLTIDASSGAISGTPSAVGAYTVTVTVTDADGKTGTAGFSWTVGAPPPAVTLTPPGSQSGQVKTAARLQLHAADSDNLALTYAASGLPRGLSINRSTGLVSGKPTTPGRFTVRITVTDARGSSTSRSFVWTISGRARVTSSVIRPGEHSAASLTFSAVDGSFGSGIEDILISSPRGAHFSRGRATLKRSLSLAGAHETHVRVPFFYRGQLLARLTGPTRSLKLKVSASELTLSSSMAKALRSGRERSVRLTITLIDASGVSTRLSVVFRLA